MFKRIKNLIDGLKVKLIKHWLNGLEDEKHALLTMAVRKLFVSITEDDVLRVKNGQWFYKDKALSKTDVEILKVEAFQFLNTKLWQILRTDIEYQACKRMFIQGKTEDDLIAGKMALFLLDAIKTRLNSMLTQAK